MVKNAGFTPQDAFKVVKFNNYGPMNLKEHIEMCLNPKFDK